MASYAKNLVTDYSAPTNGTSDASTAWGLWLTFVDTLVAGDDVTLTIPNAGAGGSNTFVFNYGFQLPSLPMARGVDGGISVTINFTGVTLSNGILDGSGLSIAGKTIPEDSSASAFIDSVNAGATSIHVKTLSDTSKLTVGNMMLVHGFDLQGPGSVPIGPAFCEYVTVTNIDAGTGVITFTPALANQYLDTWPDYGTPGICGPATVVGMPSDWHVDLTLNGGTLAINNAAGFLSAIGRNVTLNNVTNTQSAISSSICYRFTTNNCGLNGTMEIDKLLQYVSINGGTAHRIKIQSMSAVNTDFANVTFDSGGGILGTGRYATIAGCTIPSDGIFSTGSQGYGRTDRVTANNNSIACGFSFNAATADENVVAQGFISMSSGVITYTGNEVPRWASPGTWFFLGGSKFNSNYVSRILAVTQSGTSTLISTTLSGYTVGDAGFPSVPVGGADPEIRVHPCPLWYGTGNTGGADAVDFSQAGAQGKPLWSYSKRSYSDGNLLTQPDVPVWGALTAINVVVSIAYSGTQPTLNLEVGGNGGGDFIAADRTLTVTVDPFVNLMQTGTRTITPASVTSQSGDSLGSAPGNIWCCGVRNIFANHDISMESSGTWPTFSIEYIADQGITPAAVAPLRLRLHS